MSGREADDLLETLYGRNARAGHLEALIRLAAGYQFREEGIVEHLRRIAAYVGALAEAAGLPVGQARLLRRAAVFHDVGMVDVPEAVLGKQGKLSDPETAIVRRHAEQGQALLEGSGVPLLREAAGLAWAHHECFDGSGYPRGLRGEAIPVGARILAVADVFDALTSRRTFKEAYPVDVAVELVRSAGGKQFDPGVVSAFLECRKALEEIAVRLATGESPSRTGFRVSARDSSAGDVFSVAREAYFSCPFCRELHPQAAETCPVRNVPLKQIHKLSGRIVDEKYQIRGARGVGGMGTVYEARHTLIGRDLAIKFLDADLARNPRTLERFYNEARVASTVRHPNLVEVTDMGRTPEGIPYLVMELLEGWSLGRIIEERGRLPTLTAITIAVEALRTLAAVHEKGIVHRDLKPDNIYLVGQVAAPQLKILDFGVSLLAAGEGAARLTQAGDVFGTPQYMSPEQAQGRLDIDHRSDLFTVGEILYEMVTGHPAFGGANPLAVAMAVAMCEFPPPRTHVPDIDPDLEAVIAHAMKLDPAARYQCADEFLERLVAVGRKNPRFQIGRVLDLETPSEPPAPRRERRAERRPLIPLDVADPSPTIHGAYGRLSHLDPADAVEQVLSVPPPAANGLPSSAPPARPEDPEEGKPKGDRRPGG